ncbi:hypothetical protein [Leyella stercorea]
MKKIFTLLAVAFATLGASAQTLPGLDDTSRHSPKAHSTKTSTTTSRAHT